jgi:putative transposase
MLTPRTNIRLPDLNYTGRATYFLTLCCENRNRIFLKTEYAREIIEKLRDYAVQKQFAIHAYCVMPDHLHALVEGQTDASDLPSFVKLFKQVTAFQYKSRTGQRLWQKAYYDHILRQSDSLDGVAWYIWLNPVRARICANYKDYPLSGSFTGVWTAWPTAPTPWQPTWKTKNGDLKVAAT